VGRGGQNGGNCDCAASILRRDMQIRKQRLELELRAGDRFPLHLTEEAKMAQMRLKKETDPKKYFVLVVLVGIFFYVVTN
jgi:hypothetical protein